MVRTTRQKLGQHFLRDDKVARAIADAVPAASGRVVEIGPGEGALTRFLLKRFATVRAVELDSTLAGQLAFRLGKPAGLEVLNADAVHIDLDELAKPAPWPLVGNLPYAVASPIVRRLLPRHDLFTTLVVMVQQEVAWRLAAPVGDSERGLVSLEVEAYADAELLLTVPPRCFSPPPKVVSAVVRLTLREAPAGAGEVEAALALAAEGFCHRRKKLHNALAGGALGDVRRAAAVTVGMGDARPQDLALADWLSLARAVRGVV